jgi:hypothetical protein
MNSLNPSRGGITVCVAAALLAACGGGSQQPFASVPLTVARTALTEPAAGGSFKGSYLGTASGACHYPSGGTFNFNGNGNSSFLGRSSESGLLTANRNCAWSGGAILQSSRHPKQLIFIALYEGRGIISSPCDYITFEYTVHGGTGKLAHAKGSGTLAFQCSGSAYSDQCRHA